VFFEPHNDNSQSSIASRDLEEPPIQYFYCNTLKRSRWLITDRFSGKVALGLIYDKRKPKSQDLAAKWTPEKEWNHSIS
ncbi:MAG: hypothetical protein AAF242_10920, partial [Bacteroidota bacterium]